jgi:uncharacterized protein
MIMKSEPLSDVDLDTLSGVLKKFGGKNAMNVEQLDGFLTALTCCPISISPREYLPLIWGDEMINEDAFAAQPILREVLALVARHKTAICSTLQSGEVFTPLLLPDENGEYRGNDWANGFMRGMNFCKSDWTALLDDEDHGGSLVPILALAHEHDPDIEMRPYQQPISAERRENLIIGVAAGVMHIYKYFQRPSPWDMSLVSESSTYRRTLPKVGRNEPCPCGSGKKFKHCCGKITFH